MAFQHTTCLKQSKPPLDQRATVGSSASGLLEGGVDAAAAFFAPLKAPVTRNMSLQASSYKVDSIPFALNPRHNFKGCFQKDS